MAKQFTFKKILFQNSASILTSHNQIRNLVVPLGGTEGASAGLLSLDIVCFFPQVLSIRYFLIMQS